MSTIRMFVAITVLMTMSAAGGAAALFIDWIGVGGGVGPGFHGVGVGRRGVGVR